MKATCLAAVFSAFMRSTYGTNRLACILLIIRLSFVSPRYPYLIILMLSSQVTLSYNPRMTHTSQVHSAIQNAFGGHLITVEGDKNNGLPGIDIVGMPSKTISESRLRIRSAIRNSGFTINKSHYIINLAPAEIQKNGTGLDLPIALAILRLSKQLLARDLAHSMFVGELSLDGKIKPIRGILNIIETAIRHNFKQIFIPAANSAQASFLSSKIYIIPVQDLRAL